MNGRAKGEGRIAVQGVEYFVLDLTDGVAVQHSALNLLFELFRCQGDRLLDMNHPSSREKRGKEGEREKKNHYFTDDGFDQIRKTYVIRLVGYLLVVILLNQMDSLERMNKKQGGGEKNWECRRE